MGSTVADCVIPGGPFEFCSDDASENPTRPMIRDPLHQDCDSHGTRVASLIEGITGGVVQENRVSMHSYIVGHSSNYGNLCVTPGTTMHMVNTMNHIVRSKDAGLLRPHIVSISVAASGQDPLLEGAIQAMVGMGYTFVVGAGNDGNNACGVTPARLGTLDGVITVSGTNVSDKRRSSANYGSCVDIHAPGGQVRAVGFNGPQYVNGASYATSIVTGVAALYLASNGNRDPVAVERTIKQAAYFGRLDQGSLCNGSQCSPNLLVSVWVPGYMSIATRIQPVMQIILEQGR